MLLISQNVKITIPELSASIGVQTRAIERNLKRLQQDGKIKRIGSNKSGYWKIIDE